MNEPFGTRSRRSYRVTPVNDLAAVVTTGALSQPFVGLHALARLGAICWWSWATGSPYIAVLALGEEGAAPSKLQFAWWAA